MNTSVDTSANEDLKPILDALAKRVGKAGQAEAKAFATAFCRRMDAEEIARHGSEGWAELVEGMLEFARTRKRGKANVRLFNPALRSDGESTHTILQIVNDDMPFLVDSVTMALAEAGIGVHVLGHPILKIARDKSGKLAGVGEGNAESLMSLEIDRLSAADAATIESAIRTVLSDVRSIVEDWSSMRDRMLEITDDIGKRRMPVSDAGRAEAQEFLRWAAADHFTFLGYREYKDSSHEPTTGNAVIIQRLDMLDKKFETLDRSLDQIQSELRGLVTVSVRHSEHFDAIDKAIGKLETQAERVIRLESEMETMKRKQP